MSRPIATRLALLLACGVCIVKAIHWQHPEDAGHHSFKETEERPTKERADEASSASSRGTPESCWSPCHRFHETPSTRHPLPVYNSVVPGAHRVDLSTEKKTNAIPKPREVIPEYDPGRSKQVVLLQTHHRQVFTLELVAHIESLIAESAPRRVFILFSCQDVVNDLMALPSSLRPYAYPYTLSDIDAAYFFKGHAEKWDLKIDTDLPAMLFALSHPWYDFAWVMEDDVRLIGNWNSLFADAFNEAARAKALNRKEEGKASPDVADKIADGTATSTFAVTDPGSIIHAEYPSPPADLVVFEEPVHPLPSWGWRVQANNIPDHAKRHTLLTIRGLSRRLLKAMPISRRT